jgi:hypothetical protein
MLGRRIHHTVRLVFFPRHFNEHTIVIWKDLGRTSGMDVMERRRGGIKDWRVDLLLWGFVEEFSLFLKMPRAYAPRHE